MIEIIKRGDTEGEKVAQFTCEGCKSVLKAKKSDGQPYSGVQEEDGVKFDCPVCSATIHVRDSSFKTPRKSTKKAAAEATDPAAEASDPVRSEEDAASVLPS